MSVRQARDHYHIPDQVINPETDEPGGGGTDLSPATWDGTYLVQADGSIGLKGGDDGSHTGAWVSAGSAQNGGGGSGLLKSGQQNGGTPAFVSVDAAFDSDPALVTLGFSGSGGLIVLQNLPTSDPEWNGALWSDGGTLKVSAG